MNRDNVIRFLIFLRVPASSICQADTHIVFCDVASPNCEVVHTTDTHHVGLSIVLDILSCDCESIVEGFDV